MDKFRGECLVEMFLKSVLQPHFHFHRYHIYVTTLCLRIFILYNLSCVTITDLTFLLGPLSSGESVTGLFSVSDPPLELLVEASGCLPPSDSPRFWSFMCSCWTRQSMALKIWSASFGLACNTDGKENLIPMGIIILFYKSSFMSPSRKCENIRLMIAEFCGIGKGI